MDKYLLVMLIVLVMGMGFAILKNPPSLELFYGQLAGALIIIGYSTFRNRKKRQNTKKKQR